MKVKKIDLIKLTYIYGSLYNKDHYYSFNSESPLFPEYVIKYVNIADPTLHPGDSDLIPLRRHVKISFRQILFLPTID